MFLICQHSLESSLLLIPADKALTRGSTTRSVDWLNLHLRPTRDDPGILFCYPAAESSPAQVASCPSAFA